MLGGLATLAAGLALAGGLPLGSEPVALSPADFTTRIDNPYCPMTPGTRWIYRETVRGEAPLRVRVTVLPRTVRIEGIEARVVHDRVTRRGRVVEDTYDWYAQDRTGNVWYLGEDTKNYENGRVVSTEGSWRHGARGAQAGVVMPAQPTVGQNYRQEYLEGEAEDAARVLSIDEQVEVPAGHYRDAVLIRETNPLEPRVLEYKLHARGVGPVVAFHVSGGGDREELVRHVQAR
jgi:hypothetical protein